jgi:hypothetical protein
LASSGLLVAPEVREVSEVREVREVWVVLGARDYPCASYEEEDPCMSYEEEDT